MPKADWAAFGLEGGGKVEVDPAPWELLGMPAVVSASRCCRTCWQIYSNTDI